MNKKNHIYFLGTFPPRECGIATFTKDLLDAVESHKNPGVACRVVAINDNLYSTYNYPKHVNMKIQQDDPESYFEAADALNKNRKAGAVCIQHEFGIFGGEYGDFIIPFLEELEKPKVVTFHSVLPFHKKERYRRYVVRKIAKYSDKVVVISGYGKDILMNEYGISSKKIEVIPHGIPHMQFGKTEESKKQLGLEGRKVISTFGLISEGKGIHYMIRAMPKIVKEHPEALYLVIGETHPMVRKRSGEKYRQKLKSEVKKHDLKNHVMFYNKYLGLGEICSYLQATDVYITPYCNPHQISSGTLAYAIGAGAACVSTPYLYAKDALRDGRGMLVKFKNPNDIAETVNELLSNHRLRKRVGKNAYKYSRNWTWPRIADSYLHLFDQITS
jgi:glycosyltransferase involved in cell wall biosynthesis